MSEQIQRKPTLEPSPAKRRLVWPVAVATTALVLAGTAPAVANPPGTGPTSDSIHLASGSTHYDRLAHEQAQVSGSKASSDAKPKLDAPAATAPTGVLRSRGWSRDGPAS